MNFIENVKEGLRSINSNLLRTVLTALIIAVGITSLVGILTAIDALQYEINNNMASLGANSFDIKAQGEDRGGGRRGGKQRKTYLPIKYKEAVKYKETYKYPAAISIYTTVSRDAEAKHGSKKTNPNMRIIGINENYLAMKAYNIGKGRSFSTRELEYGNNVAIIGNEVAETIFENGDPINSDVTFLGRKFRIVGTLEKAGSAFGGNSADRSIFIPLLCGSRLAQNRQLRYSITTTLSNPLDIEYAMGEATGLMKAIRKDKIGQEESFQITRSESLADSLNEVTGYLTIGGFVIGFITLIGAAIGLMNIMMVSVTERTREIGVRKALGATPKRIRQQFLIEAIVICLLGGVLGVILGIVVGNVLATFLNAHSFVVPFIWIAVGLIICVVVVGLASGYYPAFKASKLDPIDSLRYE